MEAHINHIQKKIVPILTKAGVKRSSLFGSVARGEDTENSDIDILVELPEGRSLFDLVKLERKLNKSLGRKVDVITFNSVHPLLEKYIYQDLIQIL